MKAFGKFSVDERAGMVKAVWTAGMSARQIALAITRRGECRATRPTIIHFYHEHRPLVTDCPLPTFGAGGGKQGGENRGRRKSMFGRELKDKHRRAPRPPKTRPNFECNGPTLVELQRGQCKWPVNDGKPFRFCGGPAEQGQPYCTHHANLATAPGSASEQSAVRTARSIARAEAA